MNILLLAFFKLLKRRTSRLQEAIAAKEKARKDKEPNPDELMLGAYTMVSKIKGTKSCDLLTSVHMTSKHLDQARAYHKLGKARWLHNTNEQQYKPRELRIDRQLEFIYGELGISNEVEQTIIGSPNQL